MLTSLQISGLEELLIKKWASVRCLHAADVTRSCKVPLTCFASIPATPAARDDEAVTHFGNAHSHASFSPGKRGGGAVDVDVDRIKFEAPLTLVMLPFTLKPHTSRLQMNLSGTIIRADWHMREAATAPAAVSAQTQA